MRRIYNHISNQLTQALTNILAAKLRSSLAILGILVGTASVVALMNSGRLATDKALAEFKTLGTKLLSIDVFQAKSQNSTASRDDIQLAVWRQLPQLIPEIATVAPFINTYQPISFQGRPITAAIVGADEHLANILRIDLREGQFVSFIESFEHDCVIGAAIAHELRQQSITPLLGQHLTLGQSIYTIIGIAEPWKGNAFFNEDIDHAIIVPIASMVLFNRDAHVTTAIARLTNEQNLDNVIHRIKQTLNQQAPHMSIFIRSAKQIITSMEQQGHTFSLLLVVIGSIALIVGGIGVMNVMLVSVSERTKEIGLRKAMGAKNHDIQTLFLFESLVLALIGGTLGIILGLISTLLIAYCNDWPCHIYPLPVLAGFGVSMFTGVFFGLYPAHRAATLEPVAALRH